MKSHPDFIPGVKPNIIHSRDNDDDNVTDVKDINDTLDLESQAGPQQQQTKVRSFLYGRSSRISRHPDTNGRDSLALDELRQRDLTLVRLRAIEILFCLQPHQASQWPGIHIFCEQLEQTHFPIFLEPHYDVIWTTILGREHPPLPSDVADGWHWCLKVIEVFQNLHTAGDVDPSIETAYSAMLAGVNVNLRTAGNISATPSITPDQKQWIHKAIFAALCLLSATLTPLSMGRESSPSLSPLNDTASISDNDQNRRTTRSPFKPSQNNTLVARNTYHTYMSKDLRRPVSKLFNVFRKNGANPMFNPYLYPGGRGSSAQQPQHQWDYPTPEASNQTGDNPIIGGSSTTTNSQDTNHVLYESGLNYFSLSQFGRIKVEWVDTITAHLALNRSTHTLSLFKYPSLCAVLALSAENDSEIQVLSNIVNRLLPPQYYTDDDPKPGAVYREILLSYRLLFGKSSKSRKLLAHLVLAANNETSSPPKKHLKTTHDIISSSQTSEILPAVASGSSARSNAFNDNLNSATTTTTTTTAARAKTMKSTTTTKLAKTPDLHDPLLLECTLPIATRSTIRRYYNRLSIFVFPWKKQQQQSGGSKGFKKNKEMNLPSSIFPPSALDAEYRLQDSDTYSVEEDFPVFGQRLLALQMYNMRQRPSRMTDLWRDTRNPLQWYTFWAVVFVGGTSILLAILQLMVAIVQTVYGAHPDK